MIALEVSSHLAFVYPSLAVQGCIPLLLNNGILQPCDFLTDISSPVNIGLNFLFLLIITARLHILKVLHPELTHVVLKYFLCSSVSIEGVLFLDPFVLGQFGIHAGFTLLQAFVRLCENLRC